MKTWRIPLVCTILLLSDLVSSWPLSARLNNFQRDTEFAGIVRVPAPTSTPIQIPRLRVKKRDGLDNIINNDKKQSSSHLSPLHPRASTVQEYYIPTRPLLDPRDEIVITTTYTIECTTDSDSPSTSTVTSVMTVSPKQTSSPDTSATLSTSSHSEGATMTTTATSSSSKTTSSSNYLTSTSLSAINGNGQVDWASSDNQPVFCITELHECMVSRLFWNSGSSPYTIVAYNASGNSYSTSNTALWQLTASDDTIHEAEWVVNFPAGYHLVFEITDKSGKSTRTPTITLQSSVSSPGNQYISRSCANAVLRSPGSDIDDSSTVAVLEADLTCSTDASSISSSYYLSGANKYRFSSLGLLLSITIGVIIGWL